MGGDSSENEKDKPALLEDVDSTSQVDQLVRLSMATRPSGDIIGVSESSKDENEVRVEPVKVRRHKKRSARTRSAGENIRQDPLVSTEPEADVSEQTSTEKVKECIKGKERGKRKQLTKTPAALTITEAPPVPSRFEGAWGPWKRLGRSMVSAASQPITKLASRIASQLFLKFPEPSPQSKPKPSDALTDTEPGSETSVSIETPIKTLSNVQIRPPPVPDTKNPISTPAVKLEPKLAPPLVRKPATAAVTPHPLSFLGLRRRRDEHGLRTFKVQMGVHFVLKNESIRRNPKLKGKAREERDAKKKVFSLKLLDKESEKKESVVEEEEPVQSEFEFEHLLPSQYYAKAISKYDANTTFEHLRLKSKTNCNNLLAENESDFGHLNQTSKPPLRDYKLQTERLLTETQPGDPEFPYFRYKPQVNRRRAHPVKYELHESQLFHGERERLTNIPILEDDDDGESRKKESDGHFYPKTPFTAQFAHLLPISSRF